MGDFKLRDVKISTLKLNYMKVKYLRSSQIYQSICFLAHLVYQPKSLIQSCFVHRRRWHRPVSASAVLSVHTSPWHMVRHRNFILGTHMHICPPYMHIKYLMILTCSFLMAAILVFFFDLISCPHRQSQRLHITYTYVSLIYLHTQMK